MRPNNAQLETYYGNVIANCQTLVDILQDAHRNLNVLLQAVDKPEVENKSVIEGLLDIALSIAIPQAMILVKAYRLSEASKKMVEEAEMIYSAVTAAGEAIHKTKDLMMAKLAVKPPDNAAIGMMDGVNEAMSRLHSQKALAMQALNSLRTLLYKKTRQADNVFARVIWTAPPELLGTRYNDILYAFQYVLVRQAIQRFVTIRVKVMPKSGDRWSTDDIICEIEPLGISKVSMQTIFSTMTKSLSTQQKEWAGVGELPAAIRGHYSTDELRRVLPVVTYDQLVARWSPVVLLESIEASEFFRYQSALAKRETLNKFYIIQDRKRRGLNPDGSEHFGVPEPLPAGTLKVNVTAPVAR